VQEATTQFFLKNQVTNEDEQVEIYHGLSSLDNLAADRAWAQSNANLLGEILEKVKAGDDMDLLLSQVDIEDKHWEWVRKGFAFDSDEYEWFYAKSAEEIEGICVIYHPQPSKIDEKDIFYVDYIAIAPWNRKNPFDIPKFKGVGSILIKESLRFSVEKLKYRPGFSLHSLPQAVGYYEKIGMQNFGRDESKQGLVYFEMNESQSESFL